MSDKTPIDLTTGDLVFRAVGTLREGENVGGEREYRIHQNLEDPPLVVCRSPLQLHMVLRGLGLNPERDEGEQVASACTSLIGEIMSARVHKEDFYDSGRENQGYELAWLPGGTTYDKIVKALERTGEHGLAALMREGRVETP